MVLHRKSLPAIGLLCCEYPSRAYINTAFLQKQLCGAHSKLKMPSTFCQHFKSFKTTAASHSFSQAQKPRVCVCVWSPEWLWRWHPRDAGSAFLLPRCHSLYKPCLRLVPKGLLKQKLEQKSEALPKLHRKIIPGKWSSEFSVKGIIVHLDHPAFTWRSLFPLGSLF